MRRDRRRRAADLQPERPDGHGNDRPGRTSSPPAGRARPPDPCRRRDEGAVQGPLAQGAPCERATRPRPGSAGRRPERGRRIRAQPRGQPAEVPRCDETRLAAAASAGLEPDLADHRGVAAVRARRAQERGNPPSHGCRPERLEAARRGGQVGLAHGAAPGPVDQTPGRQGSPPAARQRPRTLLPRRPRHRHRRPRSQRPGLDPAPRQGARTHPDRPGRPAHADSPQPGAQRPSQRLQRGNQAGQYRRQGARRQGYALVPGQRTERGVAHGRPGSVPATHGV